MTEYNEIRAVQYPVIKDGNRIICYGLFEVHFINGAPAHAEATRIVGLTRVKNDFLRQLRRIQHAAELPMLVCTNAVTLDDTSRPWQGNLVFDHLPILS